MYNFIEHLYSLGRLALIPNIWKNKIVGKLLERHNPRNCFVVMTSAPAPGIIIIISDTEGEETRN